MGDMPCVWCLVFIQEPPDRVVLVHAYNPMDKSESFPVSHWAHADQLVRDSGWVLRDHNGVRCGLQAQTLVSGDAVCLGHAMAVLSARLH
jgi:hypothetical protein